MKLLFDAVRLWANEHDARVLHLGGGVGNRGDSLFHFKAGFSKIRHQFSVWRWVLSPHINASLVQVADHPSEAEIERVATRTRQTHAQVLDSPGTLVGSVDTITETLLARRAEFGVSYYVVHGRVMESFAPVVARLMGS